MTEPKSAEERARAIYSETFAVTEVHGDTADVLGAALRRPDAQEPEVKEWLRRIAKER